MVGPPDIFLFGIYDPDIQGIDFSRRFRINWSCILFIMFRRGTSDISPGPGSNDNVQYHEFPRFGHFVKRNGPDTGAIMTQNVIPVISVQPILYQLPYGAFCFIRAVFFMIFL